MKPARSILSKEFIYTDAANTDIRKTFARVIAMMKEVCDKKLCVPYWDCKTRGCRKDAMQRYGEQVVRLEPRPEHDLGPDGQRLKAGK